MQKKAFEKLGIKPVPLVIEEKKQDTKDSLSDFAKEDEAEMEKEQ